MQTNPRPTMGFWRCWSMTVGVMIGSGIFLLPAVLAPYGSIGLLGWVVTSIGSIGIALVLGRLANRTDRPGGPYTYVRDAFGDLPGFLIGWGYWISVTLAIAAVAIAFAGYLGNLVPALNNQLAQNLAALAIIWLLTAVNIRGIAEAASLQLLLAVLKILPLLVIIALGVSQGSTLTFPSYNPQDLSVMSAITTTVLLTMWAFIGVEAAVIPAGDVIYARQTIPRAVSWGTITVAFLYIAVSVAIMMLVPAEQLAQSQAPFVDAARSLGPFAAILIGIGALLATAGSLNGDILVAGQMPMAMARDKLLPEFLAHRNQGNAPVKALVLSSCFASALLAFNTSEDLIGAFTFLISISTLCVLAPYGISALAELKHSWRNARAWATVAILTSIYTLLAASGSGIIILLWGAALMVAGLPLYFFYSKKRIVRVLKPR